MSPHGLNAIMNRFEDLSLWRQGDQRAPHKALLDWRPEPKHMEWHGREVFKGAARHRDVR